MDVGGCATCHGHGSSGAASQPGAAARRRIARLVRVPQTVHAFLFENLSLAYGSQFSFAKRCLVAFQISYEHHMAYGAHFLSDTRPLIDS